MTETEAKTDKNADRETVARMLLKNQHDKRNKKNRNLILLFPATKLSQFTTKDCEPEAPFQQLNIELILCTAQNIVFSS